METSKISCSRDGYGALRVEVTAGAARTPEVRAYRAVRQILDELEAGDADEHRAPAWETGFSSLGKRRDRWAAVNVDLYGFALIDGQSLGVVQVRRSERTKYGVNVHKSYFLIGRNEGTGRPFAHCVGHGPIRGALKAGKASPKEIVAAVLGWIWDTKPERLHDVVRHGDVALVRWPTVRLPPGELVFDTRVERAMVVDSHTVACDAAIYDSRGNRWYVMNARLHHQKGQHQDVEVEGWARLQIGRREGAWSFAKPTAD